MGKDKFELIQSMDCKSFISYLEELVKAFKAGKVVLEKGNEFISLNPQSELYLELNAKKKEDKEKLSLEISWTAEVQALPEEESFKISIKEPDTSPQGEAEVKAQTAAAKNEKTTPKA